MVQMQSVSLADIEKHGAAGGVESHFPVVQLARLLVRIRKIKPQSFQSFFLLWGHLSIAVFAIEDMALMDVRSRFIQMQRPVNNVDVFAEAEFKSLEELHGDLC